RVVVCARGVEARVCMSTGDDPVVAGRSPVAGDHVTRTGIRDQLGCDVQPGGDSVVGQTLEASFFVASDDYLRKPEELSPVDERDRGPVHLDDDAREVAALVVDERVGGEVEDARDERHTTVPRYATSQPGSGGGRRVEQRRALDLDLFRLEESEARSAGRPPADEAELLNLDRASEIAKAV